WFNVSPFFVFKVSTLEYDRKRSFYDDNFHVIEDANEVLLTPLHEECPMARIERDLMDRRNVFKKRSKETDYFACMDKTLKRLGNSIYGQLGMHYLTLISDRLAARMVTAQGRRHLELLQKFFVDECGYVPTYGDTDSIFVSIGETDSGPALVDRFQAWLGRPVPKLEYEETFQQLVMISKKTYVGLRKSGDVKLVGFFKTIPVVMASFVNSVVELALTNRDVDTFKSRLIQLVTEFEVGATGVERFVHTKKMKDSLYQYSSAVNLPHIVFARALARRGLDLRSLGGQIHYVSVVKDVKSKWEGNTYELVEDAGDMTINLPAFVAPFVAKLKSLLHVLYDLPLGYLPNLIEATCAGRLEKRLDRLGTIAPFCIWAWQTRGRKPKNAPNLRQFVPNWNDFASGCGVEIASRRTTSESFV
ncbi:MAG TPA: DNA polymerase domain-containing protein, partial [Nitrospira sp.]|nr:DNA polymerase domain-containing protein [Nitrospira sp.]